MKSLKILKRNTKDLMKSIVQPDCGCYEYYGNTIMINGINYCRSCTREIWLSENPNIKFTKQELLRFPIYSDGVNYSEKEEDYE